MSLSKRQLKILKKIYYCPYISVAEMELLFPRPDTKDILIQLQREKYISFRKADNIHDDDGREFLPFSSAAHLVTRSKGDIAAEDRALFRANLALTIAIFSLIVSILALISQWHLPPIPLY